MNTKILAVVTPPSSYHGLSNRKIFWEEKFTLGEFTPVNTKNCDCRNVRKHREIKNGEKYITLNISLKFGSLEKMKITSPEPKYYLVRSGKGLIISMCLKTNVRSNKTKSQGMPLIMSV